MILKIMCNYHAVKEEKRRNGRWKGMEIIEVNWGIILKIQVKSVNVWMCNAAWCYYAELSIG